MATRVRRQRRVQSPNSGFRLYFLSSKKILDFQEFGTGKSIAHTHFRPPDSPFLRSSGQIACFRIALCLNGLPETVVEYVNVVVKS